MTGGDVGSTPRGIHIKSTKQEVLEAYPGTEETDSGENTGLTVRSAYRKYTIVFGIKDGLVASILLDKNLVIGTEYDKAGSSDRR